MNILRNIILFGWMAIACTAFAQDRNADKVERPNTKKINFGIKAEFFHVYGIRIENQRRNDRRSTK